MLRPGIDVVQLMGLSDAERGAVTEAATSAATSALSAIPGIGPIVSALGPYVKKAVSAIVDWFAGATYDAFGDFTRAVAVSDAGLPAEVIKDATPEERIAATLAAGVTPIYCSDSEGARNRIWQEFKNRGWEGERWGQRYASGGGAYKWYHGVIMHLRPGKGGGAVPPDILAAAKRAAEPDYTRALTRTLNLCRDGKGQFKAYNRVSDPDFDELIKVAVPVFPPTATREPQAPPQAPRAPQAPVEVTDRIAPEGRRERGTDAKTKVELIRTLLGAGADSLSAAEIAATFKRQTLDRLATALEVLRASQANLPVDVARAWQAAIESAIVDIQVTGDAREIADTVQALSRRLAFLLQRGIQRDAGLRWI